LSTDLLALVTDTTLSGRLVATRGRISWIRLPQ
jgi:hypothetical protein